MKNNSLADKIIKKISTSSYLSIILFFTFLVLAGSVPLVYFFASIFETEYTMFMLVVSVLLPLILTPVIIYIVLKLASKLKHVHEYLEIEIEKNRQKDILLFEQARFSLMGEMMANISHQWKQPLNTINLSVLNAKLEKDPDKYFDIIEDNVNYLSSTIDDFMSYFDTKSPSEIRHIDDIVKEIKSIVLTQMKNLDMDFKIELKLNNKDIRLASSISQVILNLVNNAKDACINNEEEKKISLTFIDKEDVFMVMCCDNAKKIDSSIKEKLFDPYFTTKTKHQGTGIGLYMSKQIVIKMFNGSIYYKEDPKCFYVELPYSDKCLKGK